MSHGYALVKNTAIYAVGNFGSKILSFALIPIFSFYLDKDELGLYDLYITAISFLVPIITLQLSEAIYRWLIDESDFEKQRCIISSGLFSIVCILIPFVFILLIVNYYFLLEHVFSLFILLILTGLFPIIQQILRGLGLNKRYALGGIINSALIVLLNLLGIFFYDISVKTILFCSSTAFLVTISFLFISSSLYKYLKLISISLPMSVNMLKYSVPLIPNSMSWWFISMANRFLILNELGKEYNGIFAVASRFPTLIAIFNGIFMLAWQDYVIKSDNSEESKMFSQKIFRYFINFEFGIVLILIPLSKFLVQVTIDVKYLEAWTIMPILYLATLFAAFAAYFGALNLKSKNTVQLFLSTLLGGLLNIGFTFFLLETMGLQAATLGSLLGFALVFAIRVYLNNKEFKLDSNIKKILLLLFLSGVFVWLQLLDIPIVSLALLLIALSISFLLNKGLLKKVKQFLFSFKHIKI